MTDDWVLDTGKRLGDLRCSLMESMELGAGRVKRGDCPSKNNSGTYSTHI